MHHAQTIISKAKSNPYFRNAIDTDEYRAAFELREQVDAQRKALPAVDLITEPTSGAELGDWLEQIVKVHEAEHHRELHYNALMALFNTCNQRIAAVIDISPDTVLRKLSNSMNELLAEVTETIGRLHGATTPSAVIAAGVGDVWQELHDLRRCYDQLRDAQRFIMGEDVAHYASNYLYDDPHASRLAIRDIDDVFPDWHDPSSNKINIRVGVTEDPRPWPINDDVQQLVWLTTHCQLWIPTRSDLAELERELHRKNNPEPEPLPEPKRRPKQPARIS